MSVAISPPSAPRSGLLTAIACVLLSSTVVTTTLTASNVTRVDLVIDEPYNTRSVVWPIATGVPFPRGELRSTQQCRLVDDLGQEQPLQARVAATWDAQRSSIRWLTIDFLAVPGRRYTLEYGAQVTGTDEPTSLQVFTRRPADKQVSRARDSDQGTELSEIHVATGPLRAKFSLLGRSALKAVKLDLNGDDRLTQDEIVALGSSDGEHYYLDQDKKRFTSANDRSVRTLMLEIAGPIRTCVRVDGVYASDDGKPIVGYRTRYHFFASLGLVKIVDEFRVIGSTAKVRFRDIGFALNWPDGSTIRSTVVDEDGQEGNQIELVKWHDATQAVSSFQSTYRHFGNPECLAGVVERRGTKEHVIRQGDSVGEWLQVTNDDVAVTGSLRWMWQQFPKEWQATRDGLVLHLWSPRGGELDFSATGIREFLGETGREYLLEWYKSRPLNPVSRFFYYAGHEALERGDVDGRGINKHHEFWLHFTKVDEAEQGREYGRLAAKQPLALATPEWNCATDVFGPLMPRGRPNASARFDTTQYERVVDRIFDLGRYAQDAFGDYGWTVFGSGPHYSYQWDEAKQQHYADPRRFEYHTYQKETQLWWCYFRSGERKFYDWAIPSENHWIDIATTHVPLTYRCSWRGGERQEQTLQFRPGDWSIDSPLFHVRQRDSAEAWLRGGSQFWANYHRTLETTTLAYYLTGDERYNDVIEFWRRYWSDLAGMTSASKDVPSWLREQAWFRATDSDETPKSWAEMIRDYSPFTSGLRHQMTQFFNLSTLYEHTWDPAIGQVLQECAAAYLEPDNRIGVWKTQENELPAFAAAPKLAHFWVPALWKYARVTQDPRMKSIFQKYFHAGLMADPFHEDVGRYSSVHIAYAYYYTRDSRHLRPALTELESLLPFGDPLKNPTEIGLRLYNPHTPIRCLTAIPRLLWALHAAKDTEVAIPPPAPLKPQRAPIALFKPADQELRATLWGYDRELALFDPTGQRWQDFEVETQQHASDLQPFDRVLPQFEVFHHRLTLPRAAPEGFYVLLPRLEMAVLSTNAPTIDGASPVLVNATLPVAVSPQDRLRIEISKEHNAVEFESAAAASIEIRGPSGNTLKTRVDGNRLNVDLGQLGDKSVTSRSIEIRSTLTDAPVWIHALLSPQEAWGSFQGPVAARPDADLTAATVLPQDRVNPDSFYEAGRFGSALQMVPGRRLQIPDHVVVDGKEIKLFDLEQGTIEFYIKRLWDDRLVQTDRVEYLSNGLVRAWCPRPLPLRDWAHVAVEWRPLKRDPRRQVVHIYIDGLDRRYYRSTWWGGYNPPLTFPPAGDWLRQFVCTTQPGAPYLIEELRISTVPRYARLDVAFGREQTFNPARFRPPSKPFELDEHTALLFHFDGNTSGESAQTTPAKIDARLRDGE